MSRHLSLVHATSAGCCAVGLAHDGECGKDELYWAHSITFADSVARVREATRERRQVDSTNSILLPETVTTLVSFGGRDGIRTHDLLIANEEKSKLRCGTTIT
jgi:2-methylcitrate dehydratase PrpD